MKKLFFILLMFFTIQVFPQTNLLSVCEGGNGKACNTIGTMYSYGQGVDRNDKEATIYFKKACNFNYAEACNTLGYLYLNGQGVDKNATKSKQFFKRACKLGHEEACNTIKE